MSYMSVLFSSKALVYMFIHPFYRLQVRTTLFSFWTNLRIIRHFQAIIDHLVFILFLFTF